MKLIVSFYDGHLSSNGNSVVFPKQGKKLSKSIYIQNHYYSFHKFWIYRMLHVQDLGEFGPCYDSGRKSKAKRCDFELEPFFLNLKAFLFALLCIVHINFAYPNVILLTSIKYDWFHVSKIQICTLENDVYRDLYKS